jgi:U3 small nucleolar RNA-associated protein 21
MLCFHECLKSENTFSSDGPPTLASASETGHISLWDLGSGGRLLHTVRGAHEGCVSALEWISGQPILISSGDDNSVKVCFEIGHVCVSC